MCRVECPCVCVHGDGVCGWRAEVMEEVPSVPGEELTTWWYLGGVVLCPMGGGERGLFTLP